MLNIIGEFMNKKELSLPKWLKFLFIVIAILLLYKMLFNPRFGNPDRPPSFRIK